MPARRAEQIGLVGQVPAEGIAVNTWTVNAAHDLVRMRDLGVDAIITDDVTLARSIVDLGPRGA